MDRNIRKSNFELLRVICMVMIITLHTLGHGGVLDNTDIHSNNFFLGHIIESFSIVAVNCYILISGFFGINSDFKLKKCFKLYGQVLFYSISISLLFLSLGVYEIEFMNILTMIFPITMQTWWFMSIYLALYVLSPYINKLLRVLSFKEFNKMLIILIFIFIIWPSLPKFIPIDNQNGYSLYNFILLYIIGAYISMYYKEKIFNKYILITIYMSSSILLCLFNVSVSRIIGRNWGWYSYNFILIFVSSLAVFLLFKQINIKSKIINRLSTLTLGVYLIHDHLFVRTYIYDILKYKNCLNNEKFIINTAITVFIIYISSSIIEFIRQCLFKYIKKIINIILYKICKKYKVLADNININL